MPTDLWSFTLDFYARPGVEQACLALQTNGANVCMVLCGVWLGGRGVKRTAQRLSEIGKLATPWHDEVIRPLRQLRTQWRAAAQNDPALSGVRTKVKALELEAEQTLLNRLDVLTGHWPATQIRTIEAWLSGVVDSTDKKNRDALQVLRIAADVTDA
ncbi:TIGR02444 family protein [Pseudomonas floridensis]|uniref:TIGR02444 family protein n=1 Tax=Pseudomonas floridensis TaxID=1958950 RepID=A0A1X0N5T2_9PSED|nr:TIGR02444 family protein [Pseudomonas floridensis]ORC58662.1 TIGR02444 family protein [Pseudomonas floridensis]